MFLAWLPVLLGVLQIPTLHHLPLPSHGSAESLYGQYICPKGWPLLFSIRHRLLSAEGETGTVEKLA